MGNKIGNQYSPKKITITQPFSPKITAAGFSQRPTSPQITAASFASGHSLQVQVKPERGVPVDKDEYRRWYDTSTFPNLDKRGQEAFFKFLRAGEYSEEMDIVDVPVKAEGMKEDASRYQFWLKCETFDLPDMFKVYVVGSTRLKDVDEDIVEIEDMEQKGKEVSKYFNSLKEKMKPDLDNQFTKFKTYLSKEYDGKFD